MDGRYAQNSVWFFYGLWFLLLLFFLISIEWIYNSEKVKRV